MNEQLEVEREAAFINFFRFCGQNFSLQKRVDKSPWALTLLLHGLRRILCVLLAWPVILLRFFELTLPRVLLARGAWGRLWLTARGGSIVGCLVVGYCSSDQFKRDKRVTNNAGRPRVHPTRVPRVGRVV